MFQPMLKIGIINVSDRASRGEYEDLPGREVERLLREFIASPWELHYAIVPDELELISRKLAEWADETGCSLILTTGGTGPAPRDVTPEATMAVCEKMLPGFGEQMRAVSLRYVPTAILSRQTAGIRKRTLIVNLPGRPKAIGECLTAVFPAIPYCVDLIGGARIDTVEEKMASYRPKA